MFEGIIQGLREFNAKAWGLVAKALNDNAEDIIEINVRRIHDKGVDALGDPLKNRQASYPVYSAGYTRYKTRLGLYQGHIDLTLSGDYLGAYELKADENEVTIYVNPSNADLDAVLRQLYGENIQGLTQEEWKDVVDEHVMPAILNELFKALAK